MKALTEREIGLWNSFQETLDGLKQWRPVLWLWLLTTMMCNDDRIGWDATLRPCAAGVCPRGAPASDVAPASSLTATWQETRGLIVSEVRELKRDLPSHIYNCHRPSRSLSLARARMLLKWSESRPHEIESSSFIQRVSIHRRSPSALWIT